VVSAGAIMDTSFGVFVPLPKPWLNAPGSIDYAISADWMIRAALLLGTVLFVADLSHDNHSFLQLSEVIALAGGSIALLGLLEKATGAPMIFWQASSPPLKTFFGTFYYHANAGAFLNLVWPLTAGLALRAFISRGNPNTRGLWIAIFVLTLVSVAANTSRMAQLTALLILPAVCWHLGPLLWRRVSKTDRRLALTGAAALLFALFAVAQSSRLEEPLARWEQLSENLSKDARWQSSRVALTILPDAGLFGFGPGTFRVLFPVYNNLPVNRVPGSWRFLHDDYLQTILEWGWLGAVLWGSLFFGGIFLAIRNLRKPLTTRWSGRRRLILPLIVIALIGVAIHAAVDFPLQIASIQLYAATFVGLCWGSSAWGAEEKGV
jgi:O-antigen ligase